jgi:hypothetical protein
MFFQHLHHRVSSTYCFTEENRDKPLFVVIHNELDMLLIIGEHRRPK